MFIAGKKIYLREIMPEDWKPFHDYAANEEVFRYQPWGPNSEDDSKFFVHQAIRDREQRKRSRFVFAIVLKENNKVVGNIELNITDWNGVGETGFVVHQAYWRQGIATEALSLMLKFGFEKNGLHKITANCNPFNKGTIRVLSKVGMIQEGLLRKDLLVKGEWRDRNIYGILKEEWKKSLQTEKR